MDGIYKKPGDRIDYSPVADVVAGSFIVLGGKVGLATSPISAGSLGSLQLRGEVEAPVSTSGTYAFGDAMFWNGSMFESSGTNGTHGEFRMNSAADLADGRGLIYLR